MSLRSRRHAYHRRLADWPGLTPEAFDALVRESLDALPAWAAPYLERVAVVVEDEPPEEDPHVLGLYVGSTVFGAGDASDPGSPPDMVLIFQGPHERGARGRAELRAEVVETVLHEIAHHFGIDEETLEGIGRLRPGGPPPRAETPAREG